ncbi:hypothetical protein [Ilumatobacter nonamiensis]|uniref:hypothetical protein n=1 Tax=Ilumatobacter nonamiensis TaxID=467093 RepID=UPI000683FCE2|nr:hypothetical protein [Ilumatobacter nonamiensis]
MGERAEARADALVALGLTGDLGDDELLPALAHLHSVGRLDIPVVSVGRSDRTVAQLREQLAEHDPAAAKDVDLHYVQGDATDSATFDAVADTIGDARMPVVYAAIPPAMFGDLAAAVAGSRLPEIARLVVEKPFGDDAESARALYERIAGDLGADRLRIVDHYLAKAAIENLLVVRTANPLFDNVLRAGSVGRVLVEMAEEGDVEGRGSFYDDVGVVADVVQNHVLQLAAFALMERPSDERLESLRAARAEALESLSIRQDSVVLGQYEGYREHEDVDADSSTPTFASFTMDSTLDRWRDVPIDVVTGKALDRRCTRVVFELAELDGDETEHLPPNNVEFSISPTTEISLCIRILDPDRAADERDGAPAALADSIPSRAMLCGPATHDGMDAYATILDGAISGDRTHFATIDDVVAAWDVSAPLAARDRLVPYPHGGPDPDRR